MNFQRLDIKILSQISPYMHKYGDRLCDYAPACFFMWASDYKTEVATENETLFIRSVNPHTGRFSVSFLCEPSRAVAAVDRIRSECRGKKCSLAALTPGISDILRSHYSEGIQLSSDDRESDYLYLASDLASFSGKKFSQKRNHINAFLRENENYTISPITEEDMPALREFYAEYRSEEEDDSQSAHEEGKAALRVINNYFSLNVDGIILRIDGRIVGISIAELVGDTLFIHIEKAEKEVRGAYPMLVREMVSRHADSIKYVNREEDDGDEGLRKSKRSYNPIELLQKYNAEFC